MPYKHDVCGIYKIVNTATNECYVGQSQYTKKRLKEHFRLLRHNKHPNKRLQNSYNKYGADKFYGAVEIECVSTDELDVLEESFLSGKAWFDQSNVYNLAVFAKAPMRGKSHNSDTREKIKLGRRASTFDYKSEEYKETLARAQMARYHADPKFIEKIRFIVNNPQMTYAERARALGADISSVRRLALKYQALREELKWLKPDFQAP